MLRMTTHSRRRRKSSMRHFQLICHLELEAEWVRVLELPEVSTGVWSGVGAGIGAGVESEVGAVLDAGVGLGVSSIFGPGVGLGVRDRVGAKEALVQCKNDATMQKQCHNAKMMRQCNNKNAEMMKKKAW
jgi:hypothetical protein